MVNLEEIHVTQRKLRNVSQLPLMVEAIAVGDVLPPVQLAQFSDGSIHVEDGHHRCTAFKLSGRTRLEKHEYLLVQKDERDRTRFGKIADLCERMKLRTDGSRSG